jgi:hypothetical protein
MSGETVILGKVARALVTWVERYADPADREWVEAMRAELDVIDGGLAQLRWAAGAVPVLWRTYGIDVLRLMLCTAVVVVANYTYPKFATARPVELFFFAQQFYLPVVGILAVRARGRVLAGTGIGIGMSVLGFVVLHVLGYGSSDATILLANGDPKIYIQILFFVIIGAAFGTAGASVGRFERIADPHFSR